MSPEVQQMGTLVKALSPYYSKMELLEALYWQEKELHHHYQIMEVHSKGASGGLKVGAIPSGISR